jgi:hypothetical protein
VRSGSRRRNGPDTLAQAGGVPDRNRDADRMGLGRGAMRRMHSSSRRRRARVGRSVRSSVVDKLETTLNVQFPPSYSSELFLEIDLRDLMATSLLGQRGHLQAHP